MVKIVVCNKVLFVCVLILLHVGSTEISTSPAVSKTDPVSSLPQANVTSIDPNVTYPAVNVTSADPNVTYPTANVTSTDPNVTYPPDNVTSIPVNVTSGDQITGLWTSTGSTQNGMSQVSH